MEASRPVISAPSLPCGVRAVPPRRVACVFARGSSSRLFNERRSSSAQLPSGQRLSCGVFVSSLLQCVLSLSFWSRLFVIYRADGDERPSTHRSLRWLKIRSSRRFCSSQKASHRSWRTLCGQSSTPSLRSSSATRSSAHRACTSQTRNHDWIARVLRTTSLSLAALQEESRAGPTVCGWSSCCPSAAIRAFLPP